MDVGGWSGLQNALKKPGVVLGFDPTQEQPFINYTEGGSINTIWYENAASIEAKLSFVSQDHLQGFSAWTLGLESPDIYSVPGI